MKRNKKSLMQIIVVLVMCLSMTAIAQVRAEDTWILPEATSNQLARTYGILPSSRAKISSGITNYDNLGSSLWSINATETRSAPGPFSKTAPSDGALIFSSTTTLSWEDSGGTGGYHFCYDTINDGDCSGWIYVGLQTSVPLSGLASNTTYYWHVRKTNADGTTYSNDSETAYWSFKTAYLISPNDGVVTMAIRADYKILIGGYFTQVNGVDRNHIALLTHDGNLDTSFNPNIDGRVDAIALQPDGKVLVGGNFTKVGTTDRNHLARLNPDGAVDDTFIPDINGPVYAIVVQPDGKILIGGAFTHINNEPLTYLARLEENDGALDPSFSNVILDGIVRTMAFQPDGKILIGGAFKDVNSEKRTFIAKLDHDGALDHSFNPDFDNYLMTLVLQPDGKILVGGEFQKVNGDEHEHIVRLEPSGEIDKFFLAQANDSIMSIALQTDGKMILGGYFTFVNSQIHRRIVRLDANGNVDDSIELDANDLVTSVGLHAFGKILAGGSFTEANGEDQNYFARWENNLSSLVAFTLEEYGSGYTITWRLPNEYPQFQRVTYELAVDIPIDYSMLGDADYDGSSDWVLSDVTLPKDQHIYIKARGYYSTGQFNGSGSIYQETLHTILENHPPEGIDLSNNIIDENQPEHTLVGTFSTTDPDLSDRFTYKLVSGAGALHNSLFNISGNSLRTSAVFDYEAMKGYSIRVRSTDSGGLSIEKAFTILVYDVNEAPTDIVLSNNSVEENKPINTVIGTFSSTDPDPDDTFTYELVAGTGSTDNTSFNINGNQLRTSAVFNYETKNSYSIRVRSTDQGGLCKEKVFTILVLEAEDDESLIYLPLVLK